jgi:CHAD domain-containing protein
MAWHKIDQSRVKMRAQRAAKAWNNFMEELEQVTMESNHTQCEEIYKKLQALQDEVGDNLRKAYKGA